MFSKIDKRKQPELTDLELIGCPISGKELFDLKENVGWQKLETLQLSGQWTDSLSNNIGFRNICEYNFTYLKSFRLCKRINIQKTLNFQKTLSN